MADTDVRVMPQAPHFCRWKLELDPRYRTAMLWLYRSNWLGKPIGPSIGLATIPSIDKKSVDQVVDEIISAANRVLHEVAQAPDREQQMSDLAAILSDRLGIHVTVSR